MVGGRVAVQIGSEKLFGELLKSYEDGRIVLFNYRRKNGIGSIQASICRWRRTINLCAFARRDKEKTIIAEVPRFMVTLEPESGQLPLGESAWVDSYLLQPKGALGISHRLTTATILIFLGGELMSTLESSLKKFQHMWRTFRK